MPPDGSLAGRKIAHLTTVDMSLELLLLPQLLAAQDAGAEMIGISAAGRSVVRLQARGIRHIALAGSTRGVSLRSDLRAAAALVRILRNERPDILHTHNPKPGVYGRIIGRLTRTPVVVNTVHGLYATAEDRLGKRAIVYLLEAIASRFSDAELVQNEEDFALMRRWRIAPRRRLCLLGNGVDLTRFHPDAVSDEARRKLRAELGLDDATIVVGVVARLVLEKGYREFISAAEMCPGAAFIAIGGHDGEKADALPQEEIARGRRAGVVFLGERPDVRELYSAMDIVTLPSYREGVPRSLMEAAAMGKPLVATDVRGCRQVVKDGVNGYLVPALDVDGLSSAIAALVSSPELRRGFGAASREIAEETFDETAICEHVLQAYREALSHVRRGR